ncbi:MAG: AAA family ATPase [Candidatus Thorarchaeota archaeon]
MSSKYPSISEIDDYIVELSQKFGIIGRQKELKKIILAKIAGCHVVVEGTVGVGKTTLAQAIADYFDQDFIRIDGDERYTEAKLVGHFEPPLVVEKGWIRESVVTGPLTQAMENGSILFINEANRLVEGTQNVLLPSLDERVITVPKLDPVHAKDSFFVIVTQNPESYIGTTILSEALKDRFVWIKLERQSYEEELEIVLERCNLHDKADMAKIVTKICRATRTHPELRRGASIRGAIDFGMIIGQLNEFDYEFLVEIAIMALATKIELEDGVEKTVQDIIADITLKIVNGEEDLNFLWTNPDHLRSGIPDKSVYLDELIMKI